MPTQTTDLFLLENLEDVGKTSELAEGELTALQAVADWINTYVVRPGSRSRSMSPGRSCSKPHPSMPTSRRRPPLPAWTSMEPRRGSRSPSASASASWIRSPPRQRTTIHGAKASAVAIGADLAHHGDDLLDRRRVGRVAQPLVAGRSSGVVAGHRRRRAPTPGGVENSGYGHGILLPGDSDSCSALPAGSGGRLLCAASGSCGERPRRSSRRPVLVACGSGCSACRHARFHGWLNSYPSRPTGAYPISREADR